MILCKYSYRHRLHRLIISKMKEGVIQIELFPITNQEQDPQLCAFDINSIYDAWVGLFIIVFGLIMVATAIIQYVKIRRQQKMNRAIKMTYLSIFGWATGLVFISRICVDEIFYYKYGHLKPTPEISQILAIASKYLYILIFTGSYLLQTAVLLVAYNWVSNLVQFFAELKDGEDNNKYIKLDICSKKLLKIFIPARFLLLIFIVPYLTFQDNKNVDFLSRAMMTVLLFNDLFVLGTLIFQLALIITNKKLASLVPKNEIALITKRYIFLISCIAIRAVIQLYVFVETIDVPSRDDRCSYDINQDLIVRSLLYLISRSIVANYLAILALLIIYNIEEEGEQRDKSLSESMLYQSTSQKKSIDYNNRISHKNQNNLQITQ